MRSFGKPVRFRPAAALPRAIQPRTPYALGRLNRTEKRRLRSAGEGGAAHDVWTYGALRDAVARAAGGLREAGLKPGERVMLRLGNRADFPILYLAVCAAGGIAAPTSPC
jgi:acyl-CoA synthetase (AMP-forming)/AMP-acid ligase II